MKADNTGEGCDARKGAREPQLRAERIIRMLRPRRGSSAILLGEFEGVLAGRLGREFGVEVIWVEPAGHGQATEPPVPRSLEAPDGTDGKRVLADCYSLPFGPGSFDFVAAQFTLEQLGEPRLALVEWRRVLREGGTMVLVTTNRLYSGPELPPGPRRARTFSPGELGELVMVAGFRVRESATLLPDLKLPAFYRGDLFFSLRLEGLPYLGTRGRLLFLSADNPGTGVGG